MEGDIINKLEEVKVIPMTYDYVFKSVLSENKEYLARILSNILNIDKDYILDNLVYKNTEHTKLSKKDKRKISDLIVEVENMKINLEMNKGYYKSLTHKNNMNLDEWEKENNYECVYVKLEDLDDLLSTTMNDHHMNKIVYKEIKATIKEYYKYIKDER